MTNYLVALVTPILLAKSTFAAYFLFAGCSFVLTVMVCLFMFETKGHSLEEIEKRYEEKNTPRGSDTRLSTREASGGAWSRDQQAPSADASSPSRSV